MSRRNCNARIRRGGRCRRPPRAHLLCAAGSDDSPQCQRLRVNRPGQNSKNVLQFPRPRVSEAGAPLGARNFSRTGRDRACVSARPTPAGGNDRSRCQRPRRSAADCWSPRIRRGPVVPAAPFQAAAEALRPTVADMLWFDNEICGEAYLPPIPRPTCRGHRAVVVRQ
jgi:hypothetical protein